MTPGPAGGEVVVVGAGVVGLTTAVWLAEAGSSIQVRAQEPPQQTTSAVAGAIIGGPAIAEASMAAARWPPVELTTAWHRFSLEAFAALAGQEGTGVRVAPGRMVHRHDQGDQSWARRLPGYRPCTPEEHAGFATAYWMSLPLVDMPRYLDYLARRLAAAGGTIVIGQVSSLPEVAADAGVVVNCSGVGARRLAGDPSVFPVRGQHVVVENPGFDDFFFEQDPGPESTCCFPHRDRLILGGTSGKGNWDLEPDPRQTEAIIRRCAAIHPDVAGANILRVEVGLRAARPQVRLETERVGSAQVIHNYGHGGVAVGLSWGCARQVGHLIFDAVRR